jgi:hypothetical protein
MLIRADDETPAPLCICTVPWPRISRASLILCREPSHPQPHQKRVRLNLPEHSLFPVTRVKCIDMKCLPPSLASPTSQPPLMSAFTAKPEHVVESGGGGY